jgi:hypothetical protein
MSKKDDNKPPSTPRPSKPPPRSKEQEEADKALEAACEEFTTQTAELDAAAKSLKRTTSDQKMKAVRLPVPSLHEVDSPPAKR